MSKASDRCRRHSGVAAKILPGGLVLYATAKGFANAAMRRFLGQVDK